MCPDTFRSEIPSRERRAQETVYEGQTVTVSETERYYPLRSSTRFRPPFSRQGASHEALLDEGDNSTPPLIQIHQRSNRIGVSRTGKTHTWGNRTKSLRT